MRDHKEAYLLEVIDAASGNLRGQLLIDTGKGSFRIVGSFADGDWVVVNDNENRTRVYSLSTGELKATFFGTYAQLSDEAGILLVQNESGALDVYDLKSFDKRAALTFPYHISVCSFSADGKQLLIVTANQIAYLFDTAALAKGESTIGTPGD
jgi:WD40 repeat protein